jgi:hypothetical protein
MGDRRKQALRVQFDGKLRLECHGAQITSDAGLLPFRERDEAFRLTENASAALSDPRPGKNTQHTRLGMLRQAAYGCLAGYEEVNDADRLRIDPAMRRVVGGRANERQGASTREMSRFETEMLSSKENLTARMDLPGTWTDLVQECVPLDKLILDRDSSQSETYGDQQGSASNGYFECTCYHPLFLFNQHGDLERARLRRGNHASAKFWRRVLCPVIERYRGRDIPKYFRGDAACRLRGSNGVERSPSRQRLDAGRKSGDAAFQGNQRRLLVKRCWIAPPENAANSRKKPAE